MVEPLPAPHGAPARLELREGGLVDAGLRVKINTVALTRVVTQPEAYRAGSEDVFETWLAVGWGAVRRIDIEQATCADPQCEADHGFTGALVGDDLTVRMSAAADGQDRVNRLVRFATSLQQRAAAL